MAVYQKNKIQEDVRTALDQNMNSDTLKIIGDVDESGTLLATQKMKVASIVDREGLAWTVASLVQELAKAANIPVSDVASVS
jgi:hypothetical protein